MSNLAIIEGNRPSPIASGGKIAAIIPQSMDEAWRLGKAIVMSGTAPKGMDTPEKCMIAIMRGLEVGLSPMQAVDKIAIVNGRPVIWGDGALGLVRGSGLCEYIRESIKGEGDNRIAGCVVKRKGEPDEITRTFSVADARKAGLWGKGGPWSQYPERMLQMRARAFALRDVFADVLGGLYLREEFDESQSGQRQQSSAPVTPPSPPSPPSAPKAIDPPPVDAANNGADEIDAAEYFENLEYAMAGAKTEEDIWQAWADCDPDSIFEGDATNLAIAEKIRNRRLKDFGAEIPVNTLEAG